MKFQISEYDLIRPIEILNLKDKTYNTLKACGVNTVKGAVDFLKAIPTHDQRGFLVKFGPTKQKDLKDNLKALLVSAQ